MKSLHLSTFFFLASVLISSLQAQSHTIAASSGVLHLDEVKRVTLVGHDANEILIEIEGEAKKAPERADGLKVINPRGYSDNTGIGLNITKDGNEHIVRQVSTKGSNRYIIHVPEGVSVFYECSAMNSGTLRIENVKAEIDANIHWKGVELSGVNGPMAIQSVYGSITGKFDAISQDGSISLYSVYSSVDVTVPANAKADFRLDTDYGEVFSDLDLEYGTNEDGYTSYTGGRFAAKYNGGGVDFSIKSAYSNIYLRKN